MKSQVVVAVLFIGLLGLTAVRAGDDDEEAPAAKASAKAAPKAAKAAGGGGAAAAVQLPPGDFTPSGLPPVPVQPLSSDAAALVDDDQLFAKFQPKTITGKETVTELTSALSKAQTFLNKMRRDLEGEKVWTKNVYDIIQNYQYKYLKTIKDVKMREKKVKKMGKLVQLIKQSALHAGVKRELARASDALDELVSRAPAGNSGATYRKIARKMAKLNKQLALMPRAEHLFTDTTEKVKDILSSSVPPDSGDALRQLVEKKKPAAAKPKPAAAQASATKATKAKAAKTAKKAAKGAKAAKGKKAKKAGKKAKKGGKKGKKSGKKGKKAKKAKKAKKPAPKPADD